MPVPTHANDAPAYAARYVDLSDLRYPSRAGSYRDRRNLGPAVGMENITFRQAMVMAGIRDPEDQRICEAIARRESGRNPLMANTSTTSKDVSMGLVQINFFGSLLESRLASLDILHPVALLDPITNLRAMKLLWKESIEHGKDKWYPWDINERGYAGGEFGGANFRREYAAVPGSADTLVQVPRKSTTSTRTLKCALHLALAEYIPLAPLGQFDIGLRVGLALYQQNALGRDPAGSLGVVDADTLDNLSMTTPLFITRD